MRSGARPHRQNHYGMEQMQTIREDPMVEFNIRIMTELDFILQLMEM
jgi:hypothetical protein